MGGGVGVMGLWWGNEGGVVGGDEGVGWGGPGGQEDS